MGDQDVAYDGREPAAPPEVYAMMETSLSHISLQTKELFEDYIARDGWLDDDEPYIPPIYQKRDYGWFVPVTEEPFPDSCPHELQAIRLFARTRGISWIMLDCDANTVEGLETFSW